MNDTFVKKNDTGKGLYGLSRMHLQAMREAGAEIQESYRVLANTGGNIVGQMLKGQGKFYQFNHYPKGDVYDGVSFSQYYYHSHRDEAGEHGHFHTFMRAGGMPPTMKPVPYAGKVKWPSGTNVLSHIAAIGMDANGFPISLFTTNRWVTDECWYSADDVCAVVDEYVIDHTYPCWAANKWITAMVRLFAPQIKELLVARDASLARWRAQYPERDAFEDRELEIMSHQTISVDEQIAAVDAALRL